jgi:hypothetical protein
MIQEAMSYLDSTPDMDTKLELIDTLRTVTDGKVCLQQSIWPNAIHSIALNRFMSKLNAHVSLVF